MERFMKKIDFFNQYNLNSKMSAVQLPKVVISTKKGDNYLFNLLFQVNEGEVINLTDFGLNPDILDVLALMDNNLVGLYVCSKVKLDKGYNVLEGHMYAFAFNAKPINNNGLTQHYIKNGDSAIWMLVIDDRAANYISLYEKFAADPEANQFFKGNSSSFAVRFTILNDVRTTELVTIPVNHDARRAICKRAIELHQKPVELPATAVWAGKKSVEVTNAISKPVTNAAKPVVKPIAVKPVVVNVDTFRTFMANQKFSVNGFYDDDERYEISKWVWKSSITVLVYNTFTGKWQSVTFWSPNNCPNDTECAKGDRCQNISCSRHSADHIIKRCVDVSRTDFGKNPFVDNARALIAAQCYLFSKKITDEQLIKEIFIASLDYIEDKYLDNLKACYAETY